MPCDSDEERRRRSAPSLHSVLTAAYHMLKNGTLYKDLAADHFDRRTKGKQILRLVRRIQNLGFAVQITPSGAAA
jgi:transposase